MHGTVLYCLHITLLYKSITTKKKVNNEKFNKAMQKFVRVLDKYVVSLQRMEVVENIFSMGSDEMARW